MLSGHGSNGHGYTGLFIALVLVLLLLPVVVGLVEDKMGLELEWVFNTSAQFPGLSFGAGHQGPPTVFDIDGDGVDEILFGTRRGYGDRLWCIEDDGSLQWVYPPVEEDGLPGDPVSKVSLVDADNNGVFEICLAGRGNPSKLQVINPNGSLLWEWENTVEGTMYGAPQAYDVDGDGYVEFFLNSQGAAIHRVNHQGELIWTARVGNNNHGHPTICDIDRDGKFEILCTSDNANVYCLDAVTGVEKWTYDTGGNQKPQPVIVMDVNRDGEYEALAWADSPLSGVVCISFYGVKLWTWKHPREGVNIRLCQAIGDVDGDGSMDMVLMTGDSGFCIDIGGDVPRTKWEINFTQWSVDGKIPKGAQANHYTSYQLITDIDGDNEQEVLWLAPFPIVTDAATGMLEGYYVNEHIARNRRQENGGWWGDVDEDGISEWICELNGKSHRETMIYCLTMNGRFPAKAYWPEYYHSAYPQAYQVDQDWMLLKSNYSNSVYFPIDLNIPEEWFTYFLFLLFLLRYTYRLGRMGACGRN